MCILERLTMTSSFNAIIIYHVSDQYGRRQARILGCLTDVISERCVFIFHVSLLYGRFWFMYRYLYDVQNQCDVCTFNAIIVYHVFEAYCVPCKFEAYKLQ